MDLHRIWHRSSSRRRNHLLQMLGDRLRAADSVRVVFRHCRLTSPVTQQLTTQHSSSINTHTTQKVNINELLNPVYTIQPVVTGCTTGLTKPVECLYTRYNRLSNGFDNRLYRVNGALSSSAIVYTRLRPRCCRLVSHLSIRPTGVTFPGRLQATRTSSTTTEAPNVLHCRQRRTEPRPRLKPNSITLASLELAPNMFGASSELVRS